MKTRLLDLALRPFAIVGFVLLVEVLAWQVARGEALKRGGRS